MRRSFCWYLGVIWLLSGCHVGVGERAGIHGLDAGHTVQRRVRSENVCKTRCSVMFRDSIERCSTLLPGCFQGRGDHDLDTVAGPYELSARRPACFEWLSIDFVSQRVTLVNADDGGARAHAVLSWWVIN